MSIVKDGLAPKSLSFSHITIFQLINDLSRYSTNERMDLLHDVMVELLYLREMFLELGIAQDHQEEYEYLNDPTLSFPMRRVSDASPGSCGHPIRKERKKNKPPIEFLIEKTSLGLSDLSEL